MNGVTQIRLTEDVALITFHNTPADSTLTAAIFTEFANAGINIDMISQTAPQGSTITLSFTVFSTDLIQVLELSNGFRDKYPSIKPMVSSGNCKIQLYGEEMPQMHGVAASAIAAIAKVGAELNLITTSEVDISLLVGNHHINEAIASLEETFGVACDS